MSAYIAAVLSWQIFDFAAGIADGKCIRFDIFADNAAGAYDSSLAYNDAWKYYDIARNPYVITDGYRAGAHNASISWACLERMDNCAKTHVGSYEYVVAYGNSGFIEDYKIEIAYKVIANADIVAKIAVEGRIDIEFLSCRAE